MKKTNKNNSTSKSYLAKLQFKNYLSIVSLMIVFGVVGVIILRTSSAATTQIKVTGRVYDSRTNFGPSGVSIVGCNNHSAVTTAGGYWSFYVGKTASYCGRIGSAVPSGWVGPVTTGNKKAHATSKTYEFQIAGIDCVHYPSLTYCDNNADSWDRAIDSGVDFRYTSPPPPTISSFTASPSTITAGQSSTLTWSSNGTACILAYGSNRKSIGSNGSLLVRPAQTITYSLTCSNTSGNSAAKNLTVTVRAVTSGGSTGGNSGGSSSGGGASTTTTHTTTTPRPAPDTSPPTKPTNFVAKVDKASQTILLSWKPSKDNVKLSGYQIDRSEDRQNWDILITGLTLTNFNDQTANFGVHYYYRVKAVDAAGNSSKYAQSDTTIDSFVANANKDSDTTVSSDDNVVSILIPAGALNSDAFCSLITPTDILPPTFSGYKFINGPYSLTCRDASGNTLTGFEKPLVLSAKIDRNSLTGIKQVQYFGQKDDGSWDPLKILTHDKKTLSDTVDPSSYLTFVIMGKQKKTSAIFVLVKLLLILAIILILIRFVVRLVLRKRAEQQYEDYLHKSEGL